MAVWPLNNFRTIDREDWLKIISERIQKEKDEFCLHTLIRRIGYTDVVQANREFIERQVTIVGHSLIVDEEPLNGSIWEVYTLVVFQLLRLHKSPGAEKIALREATHPELGQNLANQIIDFIASRPSKTHGTTDIATQQYLLNILGSVLEQHFILMQAHEANDGKVDNSYQLLDRIIQRLYHFFEKLENEGKEATLAQKEAEDFYLLIKPLLTYILEKSGTIGTGYIMAHTAYLFMQLYNRMLYIDPAGIFLQATMIVKYASAGSFTYDEYTMKEVVKMAETLLADYKPLLMEQTHFHNLLMMLDLYADSGWQEPLELIWRMKDAL